MDRVFLSRSSLAEGKAVLSGAVRRHLADSLRVRTGEQFLATDGEGVEYVLEAETVDRKQLVARVLERWERPPGPGRAVTLAIAPPRGGRMEIAVEKAVECGVGRIVPLVAMRSVVKGRDDSSRAERWNRVAQSATAQSGRCHLPEIGPVRKLGDALQEAATGKVLLAHPGLHASSVTAAMQGVKAGSPVTLFVGPEGGFTDEEVEESRRFGAIEVSLGPTRLRSETAAIAAVTLVVAALSDSEVAQEAGSFPGRRHVRLYLL